MKTSVPVCPTCHQTRQPLRSTLEAMLADAVANRKIYESDLRRTDRESEDGISAQVAAAFEQGQVHAISAILKLAKL